MKPRLCWLITRKLLFRKRYLAFGGEEMNIVGRGGAYFVAPGR